MAEIAVECWRHIVIQMLNVLDQLLWPYFSAHFLLPSRVPALVVALIDHPNECFLNFRPSLH